jgi:hypothetical protein
MSTSIHVDQDLSQSERKEYGFVAEVNYRLSRGVMLSSRSTSRETDSAIAGKYTVREGFFGTEVPQDDSGAI